MSKINQMCLHNPLSPVRSCTSIYIRVLMVLGLGFVWNVSSQSAGQQIVESQVSMNKERPELVTVFHPQLTNYYSCMHNNLGRGVIGQRKVSVVGITHLSACM